MQEREIERKKADVKRQLRERRVPQSQIGRAWGFAGMLCVLIIGFKAIQPYTYSLLCIALRFA